MYVVIQCNEENGKKVSILTFALIHLEMHSGPWEGMKMKVCPPNWNSQQNTLMNNHTAKMSLVPDD